MTTEEAADFLRKPVSWLYAYAGPLNIPRHKLGQQYRYDRDELLEWLRASRRT
jgi:excisionase family DNA binding protein